MTQSLEELMASYADGDESALEMLYAQLSPRLMGYFRRAGVSEETAGDLVQQTFLRLHLARGRYRRGAPLKPWVFKIASNLLTDERRRHGKAAEIQMEEGAEQRIKAPEAAPGIPADIAEALQKALDGLPDAQREVVLLHKYEGLPLQEVAEIMGCSLSAVKVRAFRAYQAMRKRMTGEKR